MTNTMDLLSTALRLQPIPFWTQRLNLHRNTLSTAKVRGHLSPAIAGALAEELGQDPKEWVFVAALESERDSACKDRMLKRLQRAVRSYFNRTVTLGFRGKKPQRQPQQAAPARASSRAY